MGKINMAKFFKTAQKTISEHSPEILTGIGIAGMLTTTVLAVKETPKALKLIKAKKKTEQKDELTPVETIKTCWKCYIPAAITCTASIACLIGASSVSLKRNAALATAYKLSETALTEYRAKVIETIGEKKEETVRDKVNKEKIQKKPASKSEVIITEKGNTLCFDPMSGRYFKSDIERIRKAENELNKRMLHDMFGYVSLNEFYDELDLDHTEVGDTLGWNVSKEMIELNFSSQIADDGTPCIVIDYYNAPYYGYDKF